MLNFYQIYEKNYHFSPTCEVRLLKIHMQIKENISQIFIKNEQ